MSAVKLQWATRRLDDALFSRIVRLPREDGQWSEPTRLVAVCTYWGGRITVTHCNHGGTVTESLSPALSERGCPRFSGGDAMTPLPRTASCRSCSEPIMFVIGAKGGWLPVEVQPSASGNVVLAHDGKHWNAGVLTPGQAAGARADGQRTYLSHFASCPAAEAHRKRAQRAAIKARSKR